MSVIGDSATNTVIFEPANGNKNSVNLSFIENEVKPYVVRFDSVSYLTLRALKIIANNYSAAQFGRAIEFYGGSHDSIIDCTIQVPEVTDFTTGVLLTGIYGNV